MNKYERMKSILLDIGEASYRYDQLLHSIFKLHIKDFSEMSLLPKRVRDALINEFGQTVYQLTPYIENTESQMKKVLFELEDKQKIEAVALFYSQGWESFCISSQCGCNFGCEFCATGTLGLKRNLTCDEITDQLLYFLLNGHHLDSISFMGMGEPLANPNVFDALNVLCDPKFFGLSQRRITVSTIGIIPSIQRMTSEFPQVNLAFSMHSAFNTQRSALMPINRKYPLDDVLDVLDTHARLTRRKIFIAYVLLKDTNDTQEHATQLIENLKERSHLFHVDLIPYNYTDKTPSIFFASKTNKINQFKSQLQMQGISVTVRTQFGSDSNAACGQLHIDNTN